MGIRIANGTGLCSLLEEPRPDFKLLLQVRSANK